VDFEITEQKGINIMKRMDFSRMSLHIIRRRIQPGFRELNMVCDRLKKTAKRLDPFDSHELLESLYSELSDQLRALEAAIHTIY
jgi:hypothetical protein